MLGELARRLVEELGEGAGAPEIAGARIRRVDGELRRDHHRVEVRLRELADRLLAVDDVARQDRLVAVEVDDHDARPVGVEIRAGGEQHVTIVIGRVFP